MNLTHYLLSTFVSLPCLIIDSNIPSIIIALDTILLTSIIINLMILFYYLVAHLSTQSIYTVAINIYFAISLLSYSIQIYSHSHLLIIDNVDLSFIIISSPYSLTQILSYFFIAQIVNILMYISVSIMLNASICSILYEINSIMKNASIIIISILLQYASVMYLLSVNDSLSLISVTVFPSLILLSMSYMIHSKV